MNELKEKSVKPKVYAVVLETEGMNRMVRLDMVVAYSLDEAFIITRNNASEDNRSLGKGAQYWIPVLWANMSIEDIADSNCDFLKKYESKKIILIKKDDKKIEPKDELMKKIIKDRDLFFIEKNKKDFTDLEIKFMKDEISKLI